MRTWDTLSSLAWLVEAGADESIQDSPSNRLMPDGVHGNEPQTSSAPLDQREVSSNSDRSPLISSSSVTMIPNTEEAHLSAAASRNLDQLRLAVEAFDGCGLKRTAMNTVFADGNPRADLMLVGEAPGAEEDRKGLPFVGAAGHLLDRMLAAIDRDRTSAYISNILFWRPPGNRNPTNEEIAVCLPFVQRHIALVRPRVLVLVGGIAAKTLLNRSEGITRLRGKWYKYCPDDSGVPVDATAVFHPAFLLRKGHQKRETWQDLISIRARLTDPKVFKEDK